ncbi:hypothetical protein HYV50_02425 [Candidatus Pacearchaeota archaeon]|nr:hypothetical protein [Candidatus Pacearchaeota archaeon]
MAEITIEIPEALKEKLRKERINLAMVLARVIKQLEEEKEMTDWSVKLQHASRKGRFDELKKKGLI